MTGEKRGLAITVEQAGMKEARQHLERLGRILNVRQIAVDEAEGLVRECEFQIQRLETQRDSEESRIRQTMEEFAHVDGRTGLGLQRSEKAIQAGRDYIARILQDVDELRVQLVDHRARWTEARREFKTVEKLRERQLHEMSRKENVLMQKMIDEVSISRHWRKTGNELER